MRGRAASLLFAAIVALTVAACSVLVADVPTQGRREQRSAEFQQLVGGLMLGRSVEFSDQVGHPDCMPTGPR